jgi:hypothetical protein
VLGEDHVGLGGGEQGPVDPVERLAARAGVAHRDVDLGAGQRPALEVRADDARPIGVALEGDAEQQILEPQVVDRAGRGRQERERAHGYRNGGVKVSTTQRVGPGKIRDSA